MLKAILISIGFLICGTILHPAHPQTNEISISRTDFTIIAESYEIAHTLVPKVDLAVGEITKKWLPEPIPIGMRHTTIYVYIRSYRRAYCSISDHPRIYIYSPLADLEATLKHELTHALLQIRYPDLPRWTHEGVASSWDGPGNQAVYRQILAWSRAAGTYPKLAEIMAGVRFNGRNATAYTASNSLVKFLLSSQDKYTLFLYSSGKCTLERAYGYQSIGDLQIAWVKWLNAPVEAQKPLIPASAQKP